MPFLISGDAEIFYEVRGQGQPLLLIAGTASDGASWAPLLPLLEAQFQLILIDNRGSGRTRHEGPIRFEDMAGDCVRLIDHLGLGEVPVLGHSLGGLIGLHLAARHGEKVSALITMGAAGTQKSLMLLKDMAELYASDVAPQLFFRLLFQWLFSAPFFEDEDRVTAAAEASTAYQYRQSPDDMKRQVEMFETIPALDASAIAAPVLAIAGADDLLAPPEAVTEAHRGVHGLERVTLPGIGHSTHWEAPEKVAELVTGFLRA